MSSQKTNTLNQILKNDSDSFSLRNGKVQAKYKDDLKKKNATSPMWILLNRQV